MSRKQTDDLYEIVKIVEGSDPEKKFDLELIKPYLNEYIRVREVAKNDYIIREEDQIKKVYYIIRGMYDMRRTSLKGQVKVLAKRRAPQFIGIDKAVNRTIQGDFGSIALETCTILEIHQDYFVECVKTNGDLAIKVIQNLSEKLAKTSLDVDQLTFKDCKGQLLFYIYQYWREYGGAPGVCRIKEKNSYTADNVGVSIRTFYRVRNELVEEGFISVNKGYIEVSESQIQRIKRYM